MRWGHRSTAQGAVALLPGMVVAGAAVAGHGRLDRQDAGHSREEEGEKGGGQPPGGDVSRQQHLIP